MGSDPCYRGSELHWPPYDPVRGGAGVIVYISIGNSDGKLTHAEWADFYRLTGELLAPASGLVQVMRGAWHSLPAQPWVNACWCVEIERATAIKAVQTGLQALADKFRQDWIAWAVAETTVIRAAKRRG